MKLTSKALKTEVSSIRDGGLVENKSRTKVGITSESRLLMFWANTFITLTSQEMSSITRIALGVIIGLGTAVFIVSPKSARQKMKGRWSKRISPAGM